MVAASAKPRSAVALTGVNATSVRPPALHIQDGSDIRNEQGSEGIDGVNGGGDSAQQPSLKRPRPAGDRDPEDPFCFGGAVATRRVATRRVFLPAVLEV